MCRAATCTICSKESWFGCGQHIPSVMDRVPESDRCPCEPKHEANGRQYPPKAGTGRAAAAESTVAAGSAVTTTAAVSEAASGGWVEGAKNFMGWTLKKSEPEKKEEL